MGVVKSLTNLSRWCAPRQQLKVLERTVSLGSECLFPRILE